MNNIVNICFSEFGGAIFKIAIKMDKLPEEQKIITLSDDLSHGPIKNGVNIEKRINMEIRITEEGLKHLSTNQKAMSIWENNKKSLDEKEYMINQYIEEGRLEEKINIAKRLKDVLDTKTVADKTGLTVGQVKNL